MRLLARVRRALGEPGLSALECVRCAGLWLADETLGVVTERARAAADPAPDPISPRRRGGAAPSAATGTGPAYRPCPVCTKRMNRVNFARRSGIVVDRCCRHGFWFDASELDAVVRWIREGGERLAEERDRQEEREAISAARFRVEPSVPVGEWSDVARDPAGSAMLPAVLRILATRISRRTS